MFQKCLAHPEVRGLTQLSDKDNIVMNYPKKDRFKDHLLRAFRVNPGCYLNNYQVQPVQVGEGESELIFGKEHVEITHKKAELLRRPK